ncbi:MAG: preprotein translocase subunit SecY [Armatimonadetes bacterium CG_4_10_14_3_um_filter_59_10]|nr:MAG: preprotein translocase subunit SecY [Armatimonadetes bacterium CG_4_8_14_3_um_filter_58_9]PIY45109.1 MAG: preprotein translocase subunit SecY [Armatimonadetes bacterium CG_4_10_14_3_um_filter_59_10]
MLSNLSAAMRYPDLRGRVLFVVGMLCVYVFGLWIPVPGIDRDKLAQLFQQGGELFGMLDIFSGGALKRFSIFALGIMPYINASIIFQLLTIAIPQIKELQREGEYGRRRISQYTRYLTVALAFVQALGVTITMQRSDILMTSGFINIIQVVLTLTAGTSFLMWLGEQITDKGIGNGVSLIIFFGIMAAVPASVSEIFSLWSARVITFFNIFLLAFLFVGTIVFIVYITQGERRIPVRYGDRVAGRKVIRGARTHLPMRVNQAGVIPIIFAVSVILFPATIANFIPVGTEWHIFGLTFDLSYWASRVRDFFTPSTSWIAAVLYALLVLGFTYFYTAVVFDPKEVADNLKKYGGQIQGFSPGLPTAQYLDRVLTRITFAGGLFLALVALMQYWVPTWTKITSFGLAGGTTLLIVVGVAIELMQQLEQQLKLRQYEGFVK